MELPHVDSIPIMARTCSCSQTYAYRGTWIDSSQWNPVYRAAGRSRAAGRRQEGQPRSILAAYSCKPLSVAIGPFLPLGRWKLVWVLGGLSLIVLSAEFRRGTTPRNGHDCCYENGVRQM